MLGIGLKLLGIGKWLSEAAGAAFRWLVRNPWAAAVIALSIALAWTWHGRSTARDERDAAKAQVVACTAARVIERKSIATLTAAINDQSARVRDLADKSAQRQNAARVALGRAVERAKASESVAQRIERAAPVAGCKSAPEVMGAGL